MEKQKEELFTMSKSRKPTLAEWTMQNGIILNQKSKPKTTTNVGAIHESPAKTTTVTTKTRDPFLEGFYSVEDKPETERRTYLQHREFPTQLSSRPKRRDLNESVRLARNDTGSAQTNVGAGVLDRPHSHTTLRKAPTQNPQPIKLPYRPSVQGPPKMTKLPYIPAQDGPPKMTQYGKQQETPSYNFRYINNQNLLDNLSKKDEKDPFLEGFNQDREDENRWKSMLDTVKRGAQTTPTQYSNKSDANISQEAEQTLQERLVEYGDDVQNFAEDMLRIAKDLPPHAYAAILTTMVSPPGSLPRIIAGRVLEDEVKKIHYSRNQYNINLPETEKDVDEWEWEQEVANCHQFTAPDGQRYIKYVSPDGKREVIFDSEWNVITADEDEGTYNYADPDLRLAHGVVDVLPWIVYGNTPEDSTKWYERVKGLFNFEQ